MSDNSKSGDWRKRCASSQPIEDERSCAHILGGNEVYRGEERLFWYDDFPHPDDPALAPTFPHHKHVPPDIRHHRIPAPEMSFAVPNLPGLLREIETFVG